MALDRLFALLLLLFEYDNRPQLSKFGEKKAFLNPPALLSHFLSPSLYPSHGPGWCGATIPCFRRTCELPQLASSGK